MRGKSIKKVAKKVSPSRNGKIQAVLVLDETGSMSIREGETVQTFNNYIEQMKKEKVNCDFTLIFFNTEKTEKRYVKAALKDVKPLTEETYNPNACTPLYDAVGKAAMELGNSKDALFIIITDGEENASKEFTKERVKKLIEEKEKTGWRFIFLGCGIDAMESGVSMGIPAAQTISVDPADMRHVANYAMATTMCFSAGTRSFTSQQNEWDSNYKGKITTGTVVIKK